MHLISGLGGSTTLPAAVLTIGAFDGIHLGHQHLIDTAVARAAALGVQSAVLTFHPNPDRVLAPERAHPWLTDADEQTRQIAARGVDLLIVVPFTRETAQETAEAFMVQVCATLDLRELWVGHDFALGRGRQGTLDELRRIGERLGYRAESVGPLLLDGLPVSSTRIRAALDAGDLALTNALLGRAYALAGVVIHGDARGRTIGFPTANLAIDAGRALPGNGVYACRAEVGGRRYDAVTNIGVRPTFAGSERRVEAHLLDFDGDLYGALLRLEFSARLRGEQKFDGIEALIAQIRLDIARARELLRADRPI